MGSSVTQANVSKCAPRQARIYSINKILTCPERYLRATGGAEMTVPAGIHGETSTVGMRTPSRVKSKGSGYELSPSPGAGTPDGGATSGAGVGWCIVVVESKMVCGSDW